MYNKARYTKTGPLKWSKPLDATRVKSQSKYAEILPFLMTLQLRGAILSFDFHARNKTVLRFRDRGKEPMAYEKTEEIRAIMNKGISQGKFTYWSLQLLDGEDGQWHITESVFQKY